QPGAARRGSGTRRAEGIALPRRYSDLRGAFPRAHRVRRSARFSQGVPAGAGGFRRPEDLPAEPRLGLEDALCGLPIGLLSREAPRLLPVEPGLPRLGPPVPLQQDDAGIGAQGGRLRERRLPEIRAERNPGPERDRAARDLPRYAGAPARPDRRSLRQEP